MPLDAVCLRAVLSELNTRIAGARIEKVYQPDREEIVLQLRGGQGACRLLFSASPSAPRIHLIEQNRENPATPPMFCMLLPRTLSEMPSESPDWLWDSCAIVTSPRSSLARS